MDFINNPNFDISEIEGFNRIDGLNIISVYLNYALSQTIKSQIPNIDIENEKLYAKQLLQQYLSGDYHAFTRRNNIRENVDKITSNKIIDIIIKRYIEIEAYNRGVLHRLDEVDEIGKYAKYITDNVASGNLDNIKPWLNSNLGSLVNGYISTQYNEDIEYKKKLEDLAYAVPNTSKALEQLNLEMKLNDLKIK